VANCRPGAGQHIHFAAVEDLKELASSLISGHVVEKKSRLAQRLVKQSHGLVFFTKRGIGLFLNP
jgi:hypothetical protein